MRPEEWHRCLEIFSAALERQPEERAAFVEHACAENESLRREVTILLRSHEESGDFISTPAFAVAPDLLADDRDALIGTRIGPYRVESVLGSGGMSVVYLAHDERLGRKVGLKLLPQSLIADMTHLSRLEREARTASALNHPNIVTIHDIGSDHSTHYIASELIEGETLRERLMRGPIQLSEAVDIASQVASALVAAHDAGVVHRDIKPENIMLRPDGYVKVLDFGIAKVAESAFAEPAFAAVSPESAATADGAESTTVADTNLGSILGTARYMSPEQARGAPVDKRTDIWSLGVVFYEMATGHAPFAGDTPREVMSAILEKEPLPLARYIPHAPAELQQIISKTLRKDREQRYQSAHELLQALKNFRRKLDAELERAAAPLWLRWARSPAILLLVLIFAVFALAVPFYRHRNLTTTAPPEKSIAVLPFENLSGDPGNAYFADGIQQEILTRLASIAGLKVISRTSTQQYQDKPRNLREIAKQLGVANIVEGSVQKKADQVRVNVQLINAQTDSHLWADTYDRKLTDIFGVESEIAKGIAESLQARLTSSEQQALAIIPTNNPEAYDAYLRGLAFEVRSSTEAVGFYERAVQLDPNFSTAWARLSRANALVYFIQDDTTAARRDAAKNALQNAQKLGPNSPETLLALGYYQYWVLRDYGPAKTIFSRVSKMLPGSSEAPMALALIARREGRWDQSIAHYEQALGLDPRNVELLLKAAVPHAELGQFLVALKLFDRALDIAPNDSDVMAKKADIYQAQGDLPRAARFLRKVNAQTSSGGAFGTKINQLRLERNYGEAVRLLKVRLAQFHYDSDSNRARADDQVALALMQRLAGDTADARVTAEKARNTLEELYRDQPDNAFLVASLCQAYAEMGQKDSALKLAERAIMLVPRAKDPVFGPTYEENLAVIQTMFGETGRAISTLTQLSKTPYLRWLYGYPVTPALLRLDPIWDPLRNDPRFQELTAEESPLPEKSIAVLPLENLSDEKENAFFAAGIHDELLSNLSKIADLKVISRTSVMQYKSGDPRNIREIGQQLGVAHVLEGSVQRTGGRVRVNVQMIDARNDSQIWAETYDRTAADLFAIQSELAESIVSQLQTKLSPQQKADIEARPTQDLVAYELYLRAKQIIDSYLIANDVRAAVLSALQSLDQAIKRDPDFLSAYCYITRANDLLYFFDLNPTPDRILLAEAAVKAALRLRPHSSEAHFAMADFLFRCHRDYDGALKELAIARPGLPNDTAFFILSGYINRRRNNWAQAERDFSDAVAVDPRNPNAYNLLADTYNLQRRHLLAAQVYDRVLAAGDRTPIVFYRRASAIFDRTADSTELRDVLAKNPDMDVGGGQTPYRVYLALIDGNFAEAERVLAASPREDFQDIDYSFYYPKAWFEAMIARAKGDSTCAAAGFAAARNILEQRLAVKPEDARTIAVLAQVDAGLGRKELAIQEAQHAVTLMPLSKDIYDGALVLEGLAQVYTWTNEPDRAIELLQKLAAMPSYVYYDRLKLLPMWNPLRGDPRFDKIVAAAKAASR